MSKKFRFSLLAIVLALGVFGFAQSPGAQSIDGAALYAQDCASCHGPLATSAKLGRSATQIQNAINTLSAMSGLKSLTTAQIKAIAAALAPAPPPSGDTTPPNITAFSIPSTSSSLTVPIQTLAATDDVGVTDYMVAESPTTPNAAASGWTKTAPSAYTFASSGTKTLYAWAKDAAGNVSGRASAQVTITLSNPPPQPPPPQPPAADFKNWEGQWLKVKIKYNGYSFGKTNSGGSHIPGKDVASPGMGKDQENIAGYLNFTAWDPNQGTLQGNLYQFDSTSSQWVSDPLTLHFIDGTPTDFLSWSQANGDSTVGFTARIQGKQAGGILTSATFTTLGGYYFEMNPTGDASGSQQFLAGEISVNGSLVPASKVPVPK